MFPILLVGPCNVSIRKLQCLGEEQVCVSNLQADKHVGDVEIASTLLGRFANVPPTTYGSAE